MVLQDLIPVLRPTFFAQAQEYAEKYGMMRAQFDQNLIGLLHRLQQLVENISHAANLIPGSTFDDLVDLDAVSFWHHRNFSGIRGWPGADFGARFCPVDNRLLGEQLVPLTAVPPQVRLILDPML